MNKLLIRKLNMQAAEYATESCPEHSRDWYPIQNLKFAELIVRECAKSANDWYQNHDKIHCDPMSYVLAHFGVEE